MVLETSGTRHLLFRDLAKLLRNGDLLVLNETRVIAARLFGEHAWEGERRTAAPASRRLPALR